MGRPSVFQSGPVWWQVGGVALVLLVIAYANGLDGAFVFDDELSVRDNESIRSLWPLGRVLWTPGDVGRTHDGRPLVNLSFAISYALHGLWRPGLRVGNLLVHLTNACLVFEVARRLIGFAANGARSLTLPSGNSTHDARHRWLAAAIAMIWAIHPLHTNVITYIVQRAESLAATWILGSFLAAMIALERGSVAAICSAVTLAICGGLTKETTVSILPLVAAFDWAYHDRFAVAYRSPRGRLVRAGLYGGLALNLLTILLVGWATGGRGTSAGFGSAPIVPYFLTQCVAVWLYLGKVFWPATLVLDRGNDLVSFPQAIPWLIATVAAAVSVAALFWRWPKASFPALAAVLLLAPTSSIVPIATQTVAEHRMYLASAGLIGLAVIAATVVGEIWCRRIPGAGPLVATAAGACTALVLSACIMRTMLRNQDFATPIVLWTQNMRDLPSNPRGLENLGTYLRYNQQYELAARFYRSALSTASLTTHAASGLGDVLIRLDDWAAATEAYRLGCAAEQPRDAAHFASLAGLASCQVRLGDPVAALATLQRMTDPAWGDTLMTPAKRHQATGRGLACKSLALKALAEGDASEILLTKTIEYARSHPDAAETIARTFEDGRAFTEAAVVWKSLAARDPVLLSNLAVCLIQSGQIDDALVAFRKACLAFPDDPGMLANAARALAIAGRPTEAVPLFEQAVDQGRARGIDPAMLTRWAEERDRAASVPAQAATGTGAP